MRHAARDGLSPVHQEQDHGVSLMITVHTMPDAFSAAECRRLLDQIADRPTREGGMVRQQRDHNIRRAKLVWLDDVPETDWVMDRAIDLVRSANREVFDFDITDFAESAQVASYDARDGGHFDWHSDIGDGRLAERRKLTIVVQLTPEDAYEGGALDLMPGTAQQTAPRAQGCATLFPSFVLHRVTPVTRGQRKSLTLWCHGPAFR